jgi:hypothetical protein
MRRAIYLVAAGLALTPAMGFAQDVKSPDLKPQRENPNNAPPPQAHQPGDTQTPAPQTGPSPDTQQNTDTSSKGKNAKKHGARQAHGKPAPNQNDSTPNR